MEFVIIKHCDFPALSGVNKQVGTGVWLGGGALGLPQESKFYFRYRNKPEKSLQTIYFPKKEKEKSLPPPL